MGTSCPKLKATPKNVSLTGKEQANVADYVSLKNIPGFGKCRSLKYPPTASATAAHHGKLTPMPCVPGTCPKWKVIDKDSLICGEPALLKPATLKCMYGGTISIVDPGQILEIKVRGTSTHSIDEKTEKAEQEISEELLQEFKELDTKGLDEDSVLDGVQLALDAAGMVPVLGAVPDLINASISVLRGDWVGAGLSILAAVPGVGDVVGGAKIAYKGTKIAGKATKAVKKSSSADVIMTARAPSTTKMTNSSVMDHERVGHSNQMTQSSLSHKERQHLLEVRAKRAGVNPGDGRGEIAYDTLPDDTASKSNFGEITLQAKLNKPSDNELMELEVDPNSPNIFASPITELDAPQVTKSNVIDAEQIEAGNPDSLKEIYKYKGNQPRVEGVENFPDGLDINS